jgi:hypothetical protein
MPTRLPVAALIEEGSSGRWRFELRTLGDFRAHLGEGVVQWFCCCFVHADRLSSLISFGYLSLTHYGEATVAFARNLQTTVWFAVGTLRELALAVRGLRSALARRGLLDPQSPAWLKLRTLEDRWENDPFFRELRNSISFHVDADAIEAGLQQRSAQPSAVFMEGEGEKQDRSSLRLGLESLLLGSGRNLGEFDRFFEGVAQDLSFATLIQEAFIELIEKKGLTIVHEGDSGPGPEVM